MKPQCGGLCFNLFRMILLFVCLFCVFINSTELCRRIQNVNGFVFFVCFGFFLFILIIMCYNTNFVGNYSPDELYFFPLWSHKPEPETLSLGPPASSPPETDELRVFFFLFLCFYVHDNPLNPIKNRKKKPIPKNLVPSSPLFYSSLSFPFLLFVNWT